MANVYVYSGAAGAGTGADWTNAYTTLAAACTAKAAGDTFFVAHDHAETQASAMTITSKGTETNPCRFYCVNRAGSVPPVSADLRTTATVTTTGNSNITMNGTSYWSGMTFSCGTTAVSPNFFVNGTGNGFTNCKFATPATGGFSAIVLSAGGAVKTIVENSTIAFGNTGHQLSVSGILIWKNTSAAIQGATVPTSLFASTASGIIFLEGIDLSALGSGKSLVTLPGKVLLKDCKLGASVSAVTGALTSDGGTYVRLIRTDSGDTNYRTESYDFFGTLTTETTVVRTGGATDGTTAISWKIVTTANSRWEYPFECLPISVWNETTGSAITVTIQGIWGGGAVPLNDEIWIDVEYLGTSGFPLASKATSTKADGLATGTNIAAGSGTWGGSTTKFAMSATITPQEKGPLTIYVKAAKVSSTFYVDPKPIVT
jgi:hypothetical protein